MCCVLCCIVLYCNYICIDWRELVSRSGNYCACLLPITYSIILHYSFPSLSLFQDSLKRIPLPLSLPPKPNQPNPIKHTLLKTHTQHSTHIPTPLMQIQNHLTEQPIRPAKPLTRPLVLIKRIDRFVNQT